MTRRLLLCSSLNGPFNSCEPVVYWRLSEFQPLVILPGLFLWVLWDIKANNRKFDGFLQSAKSSTENPSIENKGVVDFSMFMFTLGQVR